MQTFLEFLAQCPSSFHAAEEVARRLVGFKRQDETQDWDASPGGHYVIRDGAVIAWWIPEQPKPAFRIIGSHTDSPGFMLKPNPNTVSAGWHQSAVEVYGAPILSSWFDRELQFAGRVVLFDGSEHLVTTGPILRIPNLAIHLNREQNATLSKEHDITPLFAVGDCEADIVNIVAERAEVPLLDIASWELITCDTQPPRIFGANKDFIASGRLDNLSSVFASVQAFEIAIASAESVLVLACFNHEEVGSASIAGAAGPFLADVLQRTANAMGIVGDELAQMYAHSSCVSADAAHSIHPNYVTKHDSVNRPLMNHGPAVKLNANQRYASNAKTVAIWERACRNAGVPSQKFTSNNDVPCGSTIGPITATRLGIPTVDVGVPLLSMHSAREMVGVHDMEWLTQALYAYLLD